MLLFKHVEFRGQTYKKEELFKEQYRRANLNVTVKFLYCKTIAKYFLKSIEILIPFTLKGKKKNPSVAFNGSKQHIIMGL